MCGRVRRRRDGRAGVHRRPDLAAREGLDNLTFIVNCNLQRLDGPVRGNGQIVQELEALFSGAGWNVIKVLWGSEWDACSPATTSTRCCASWRRHPMASSRPGRQGWQLQPRAFLQPGPGLQRLVAHMSSEQINALKRGGHDFRKLHAAYAAARRARAGRR
jgi:pyruvate dehydrogenase E1 component